MDDHGSCEWSIVCDDALTGEPRGLVFCSTNLTEQQALNQAQAILSSFKLLGSYIRPNDGRQDETCGLYLFTYIYGRRQNLGAIWAHSVEDATNTLNRMARCGNLLCYCEPE